MKKFMSALLSMAMMFSLVACSSNGGSADAKFTAGTYTGSAKGNNADVVVEVTLSAEKIENVVVKEHSETPGLSDAPIANIPAAIVETQSLAVDVVAGATNTSKAILAATEAALTEAGADVEALKNAEGVNKEEVKLEDATYDVVVLGAGGAGLAAAIEAQGAGANVVVIEKMPYAGGNTLLSYAELACPNNWLQEEKGIEDTLKCSQSLRS